MKKFLFVLITLLFPAVAPGQDDLMHILEENAPKKTDYAIATFKSTRIMNGHSVESMPPGQLDFRISHRFGTLNQGAYNLFGIDQIYNVRFGLEYGFLNWLMAGMGRSLADKTFDAFLKFTILKQSAGEKATPVTVSALTSVAIKTINYTVHVPFSTRTAYTAQVLAARKMNKALSLQITPSYVRRNLLATETAMNNLYAIGAGGKLSLTKRFAFNAEYYYLINPADYMNQKVYNPLTLGFDIYTGGHVFQLMLTNSIGTIEKAFIGETNGSWTKGDIHFGFNISRVFTLKKPEGIK